MVRSLFCSKSVWGTLAVLALTGTASAQWFPFGGGSSCNCGARPSMMSSAPIMQSASYSAAYNPMPVYQTAYSSQEVSCGQPVNCTISQPVQVQAMAIAPVQTVRVQAMQQVVQPVYDTVHVTEYQAVKQKVSRPVIETKWVDQAVTEMRPVTTQRTANVPTVEYQTVTENKQVGYWATKTEAVNKVSGCAYDNRPGVVGWMNRTSRDVRNAVTPNQKVSRTFVPQTMTCTVPCSKKVAVQGMKQVTYNVTSMVAQQTTRKVAVNTTRYVEEEVTAMKPVTVARTMQVGTRVSYAPAGTTPAGGGVTASGPTDNSGVQTGLTPTPVQNARRPDADRTAADPGDTINSDGFNRNPKKISYPSHDHSNDRGEVTETVIPSRSSQGSSPTMAGTSTSTPSVVRVSQWVARTPRPASPSSMALAGNAP
jgi:hypothetical protein